jgi:hypothetical protein
MSSMKRDVEPFPDRPASGKLKPHGWKWAELSRDTRDPAVSKRAKICPKHRKTCPKPAKFCPKPARYLSKTP